MDNTTQLNPAIQQRIHLGLQQLQSGQWPAAEATYRDILRQRPSDPDAHYNLAVALRNQGRFQDAMPILTTAIGLRPNFPEAFNAMGEALRELNQPEQAKEACRRALELRPNFPEVYQNLALLMEKLNRPSAAIEGYRRAIALRPDYGEAWNNMGIVLQRTYQRAEAVDAFRRAVAFRGNLAPVWNNLGGALKDMGQLDEALTCFDRAIAIEPEYMAPHASRICGLHYHPAFDAPAIFREVRQWNDRFARPLATEIPKHANIPDPQRRLRIGYVSPDFREHCAALFIMPLLSRHDRANFELVCYSNVGSPDAVTARFQRRADLWRDTSAMSDAQVAQLVLNDRIDILVDLALHTKGNRLLAFARKPAPIQVTWLGYPGTTGLDTVDYRFTDPHLDPPDLGQEKEPRPRTTQGNRLSAGDLAVPDLVPSPAPPSKLGTKEIYYSERSVRLPDSYWCYDPRGMDPVEDGPVSQPNPLPALTAGHFTFGSLNNFCKINDPLLAIWGRLLAAVPGSHILLVAPPGPHREVVAQKLGIPPSQRERVESVPYQSWREYLETYHRIDLCLDTLPFNGGTTSLDALWMGVPVITLMGRTLTGRAGLSHLHNLDLTELVARTEDEFFKLAVDLAGDLNRLAQLRATLRPRMEKSALMDAPRFVHHVETAYRQMWEIWCRTRS